MSEIVALCVTCIVDQFYPEIGVAAVKILRRSGAEVVFPKEQTCCGQPFFNSGHRERAAFMAMRTIEVFERYPTIVLPSGSCTAMIRAEYPHLLHQNPEWQARALTLAEKTFELSEFLANRHFPPSSPTQENPPTATYHDSCHMCRTLQLKSAPRKALQNAGFHLHEMEEPDRCCGFGGLFSLKMPEISDAMTLAKLDSAGQTGADLLITADPGCLMQLRGLSHQTGLRVEHLATVLADYV